ncbi:MAG TPA: zinc-binding dehydrogenase [Leptospiraceae bacterium]|nr:zinc-binding dehydrogenase [Leptospiraceae bacterium]HMW06187.1 zinc-binding dehydrogenase [Leptospiraceae bacterium]HMX30685.1 zinc-binding dehydrogenase [Leptospiraceae bacterium]HMY31848.1 zinc-binding dehydrogenase [Leptospiraceae bacterium]HMZ64964.1 zinc-binding dehydrogenase [Leptospiraceae bacterium]
MTSIPETGKAIELINYDGLESSLRVAQRKIGSLKETDVLVKIYASSINPSDLMFIRGLYGIKKKIPCGGGFEGSGTIVAIGSAVTRVKVGDRVACSAHYMGDGSWAEYMVTPEYNCIPLIEKVTLEQGATFFVNPLTACGLTNIAIKEKRGGIVQTAAASALGKMIQRYAKRKGLPVINIVRKDDQVELLKSLGSEHVLNSTSPDYEKNFTRLVKKLEITYAIDAVAGKTGEDVLNMMPGNSKLVVYGALSEDPIGVSAGSLIFQRKKVEGFWLSYWIADTPKEEFAEIVRDAQENLSTDFKSEINKRFSLDDGYKAIEFYKNNMTSGKVLFVA